MSATLKLFDLWKVAKGYPSDRQAMMALGLHPTALTPWKEGRNAGADVIEHMAKELGENPAAWAALAMSEQTKGETARAWSRIARQLGAAAAIACVVVMPLISTASSSAMHIM